MTHRLRFAPSPTGYLHVGGARTALFNWLYCKHYGGQFLLRIEDTDKARSTDESTRAIFDGMEWLGLLWDEEVVYQGANLAQHQADAQKLLRAGKAYHCFCTPAELDEQRKAAESRREAFRYDRRCERLSAEEVHRRVEDGMPFVVRFRMPDGRTSWDDLVKGTVTFANEDIGEGDFIILRSDGTPIYNLAVVSDDIAMGITLVMRGDDHVSNTPKQILLYQALDAPLPQFAHLPNIHGSDGRKLSKRRGAVAVSDYQNMGILPQAMLNFIALLGWSPGNDIEVMTVEQMIDLFSVDRLSKNAAVFDMKKLEWMNGQHLAMMQAKEIRQLFLRALASSETLPKIGGVAPNDDNAEVLVGVASREAWLDALIDVLKVRSRTLHDMVRQAAPFLSEKVEYEPDAAAKAWKDREPTLALLESAHAQLSGVNEWREAELDVALRALAEQKSLGVGKVFAPLRVALTGMSASPGIFDVLVLLGRDRSLERIDAARRYLERNI